MGLALGLKRFVFRAPVDRPRPICDHGLNRRTHKRSECLIVRFFDISDLFGCRRDIIYIAPA